MFKLKGWSLQKNQSARGEAKSAQLFIYITHSTVIQSASDCFPERRLRRCFQFSCFAESASAIAKSNGLIAQKRHAAPFGSILGFATAGAAGTLTFSLVFCFPCALFGVCIYLFWGGERVSESERCGQTNAGQGWLWHEWCCVFCGAEAPPPSAGWRARRGTSAMALTTTN